MERFVVCCHGHGYPEQQSSVPIYLSSAQKANVLANSPASCQLFCKETPRSLEQQLQEHR